MRIFWLLLGLAFAGFLNLNPRARAAEVLVVADEFPAMEILAAKMKAEENLASRLVWQTNLPPDLSVYSAVVVYIHKGLLEATEKALIQYTKAGGKLVALHHSISSGKRKNKDWFPFLGVDLVPGDVQAGGYKWIEGVAFDVVNLAPDHFITTHKLTYPAQVAYRSANSDGGEKNRPGFHLDHSEIYLNHQLTGPRKLLLGFKYTDAKSGQTYQQDCAGWIRPAGQGWIIYFLPGHSSSEFQSPTYSRLVLNALIYQP